MNTPGLRDPVVMRVLPNFYWLATTGAGLLYSERPQGAGFRSVNPTERWRENPARALARVRFSQHLECQIHWSESIAPRDLSH